MILIWFSVIGLLVVEGVGKLFKPHRWKTFFLFYYCVSCHEVARDILVFPFQSVCPSVWHKFQWFFYCSVSTTPTFLIGKILSAFSQNWENIRQSKVCVKCLCVRCILKMSQHWKEINNNSYQCNIQNSFLFSLISVWRAMIIPAS